MASPSSSASSSPQSQRVIYTEAPYAAVLEQDYLERYCSSCHNSLSKIHPCPNRCRVAAYCDEDCCANDSLWHKFECAVYGKSDAMKGTLMAMSRIRLAARILARLRVDGGAASLSDGFPPYVTERKFSDLLSHYDEFNRRPNLKKKMQIFGEMFQTLFLNTPLSSTPLSEVIRVLCTAKINGFAIGLCTAIGVGLYLNASRFNHSCRATAYVRFDGCRMVVLARGDVHPDEYNNEVRFSQLTVNYGTPPTSTNGCLLTLTRQRVESLKRRYFFRCICDRCVNSMKVLLEERAAAYECQLCAVPRIWTTGGQLLPMCGCQRPEPLQTRAQQRAAIQLDRDWKNVMETTFIATIRNDTRGTLVVDACWPILETAARYWHPTVNLRLAQIVERVVAAYGNVTPQLITEGVEEMEARVKVLHERHGRSWWWRPLLKRLRLVEHTRDKIGSCNF